MRSIYRLILSGLLLSLLTGCAYRPMKSSYAGPPPHDPQLDKYYKQIGIINEAEEVIIEEQPRYWVKEITLKTTIGEAKLELYQKRRKTTDELVFVFPILGGKYWFERYFAKYLVRHGIDAAIILRNPEFKKPENIDRIEEMLKEGILRDRLSFDYFYKYYKKRQFGSFGISRGGINVAITAGVDKRLRSNVIVMGGTDIVGIFKETRQNGVEKYIKKVLAYKGYERQTFFKFLDETVRTDPKNLARYIDASHTLMFITVFDRTVPASFQHKLREEIGYPSTYYLPTDHYLSLLLTQFVPIFPPFQDSAIFPLDFIEAQSVKFYRKEFKRNGFSPVDIPYDLMTLPSRIFFYLWDRI